PGIKSDCRQRQREVSAVYCLTYRGAGREDVGQFANRDVFPLNLMMLLPDYSLSRHFSRYSEG
ncbi:hypothetical protein ACS0TW_40550, partial [Klebsiella michiganensis]